MPEYTHSGLEKFFYFINLDERGEFYADVRDSDDNTVWEIADVEHLNELVEDGFIQHGDDIDGIEVYLLDMEIIPENSALFWED